MIDAGKNSFVVRTLRRLGYWICRTFFLIEQARRKALTEHIRATIDRGLQVR